MNPTEKFINDMVGLIEEYEEQTGIIVHGIQVERIGSNDAMGEGFRSPMLIGRIKLNLD